MFARAEKQKYITFKVKTNTIKGEQVFTRAEGLSSIIIDISSFTQVVYFVVSLYFCIVYVNVQEYLKRSIVLVALPYFIYHLYLNIIKQFFIPSIH